MTTVKSIICALALIGILTGCGNSESNEPAPRKASGTDAPTESAGPSTSIVFEDPEETEELLINDEHPAMDVTFVEMDTDGEYLNIAVILNGDYDWYMEQLPIGAPPANFHFDTDNDSATGGQTWFGDLPGFEFEVNLLAGVILKRGDTEFRMSQGGAGDDGVEYVDVFGAVEIKPLTHDTDGFMRHGTGDEDQEMAEVDGNGLYASIPYSDLGIESGDVIRVLVNENHQSGTVDEVYLPTQLLEVK